MEAESLRRQGAPDSDPDGPNEAELRDARAREQAAGPRKQHGDALLEGNGSRHGVDSQDEPAEERTDRASEA